MGELVPYDELLDSGRLDWLWDGRLHTMYGYTSHDLATFVIEDAVVTELYLLRNPEKLSRLGQVVDLTR